MGHDVIIFNNCSGAEVCVIWNIRSPLWGAVIWKGVNNGLLLLKRNTTGVLVYDLLEGRHHRENAVWEMMICSLLYGVFRNAHM